MTKHTLHAVSVIMCSVLLSACTAKVNPPTPTNTAPTTTANEESMNASLREILDRGGSIQCSFSFNDDQTKSQTRGSIFVSGKKFAEMADVTISGVTTPQKMNIISDGNYVYSWTQDSAIPGIKMKFEATASGTTNPQAGASFDKKMDMKCSNWIADDNKFVVPNTVSFTDISSMVPSKVTVPVKPTQVKPTVPANIPVKIPGY